MISAISNQEMQEFFKICEKLETFVRYVLKAKPTKQQLEVIKAVDNNKRYIAVKSGHGVGKSTLLSWIAIWICISKQDAKVPVTAPSAPQLSLTLFPEVKKWLAKLPSIFNDSYDVKMDEIRFENNNFIALRTARKEAPEALQGFHAENLVYLVDEASGVTNEIFEVISGALTGNKNMLIMVGNPTRTSGFFYDSFHKNKKLWATFTLNAEESENVSKQTIERARQQYGVDSDAYRVRILGEFPRASSDALFSIEILDEAIERENVLDNQGSEIWGLDVAEFGDDYSVLCKRNGFYIRGFEKYSNLDAKPLADEIAREYQQSKIKPLAIYIDVIGVGAGVWSILSNYGLPAYRGDVRAKSYKEGMFNKRIEIYQRLKERMSLIRLPDDDELYGELGALKYEFAENSGDMKLESKKDTKKTLGRSPDKSDSLALTFYDEFDITNKPINESQDIYYEVKMNGSVAW